MEQVLIGFVEMMGSHSGANMAWIIVTCVHVPVTVHRSGQCRISYV